MLFIILIVVIVIIVRPVVLIIVILCDTLKQLVLSLAELFLFLRIITIIVFKVTFV
jgi:hypothetical protein